MTITDIVEISKTRSQVFIDNEAAFVLYKGELGKLHIKKDGALSEESFRHIMDELLMKRARLRCLNLLKSRDYTRSQLISKLRQGLYPETVIEDAIAYTASYGYIDDERYAAAYIKYAGNTKSRKQIENDLRKKGVSKQDIENAYLQCEEKNFLTDESELIKKLLEKKKFRGAASTPEERRKTAAFLYRKGFSSDKIYKAIDQFE